MNSTNEYELFAPVDLCDQSGNLNPKALGWSRTPLQNCNLSGHPFRKKRWNYWCVTSQNHLFSATLSNVDYMGLAFAYFYDMANGKFSEQTVMSPFGSGFNLPQQVVGRTGFTHPKMQVDMDDAGNNIHLVVKSPDFGGQVLDAEFSIQRPQNHETLNVVIPWSKDRFQFTSKQECLPATGRLTLGQETIDFPKDETFACLDFGRGIWKYASSWNWAAFSGKSGADTIGANLGAQWTDGTGFTENGLVINGHLVKIGEDLIFEYDAKDYMKPWKISSPGSKLVQLTFVPQYERIAKTDLMVLRSEVHQMIGRFNGTITSEDGREYAVENMVGWAEEHFARW